MPGVVILSAVRTPYVRMLGAFSEIPPPSLMKLPLLESIRRSGVDPAALGRIVLGNVSAHGFKGNPAAAAFMESALPSGILPITVRAGCASGLLALALAVESIEAGRCDSAVGGGFESSSFAPHLAFGLRRGFRLGGGTLLDAARHDGPAPDQGSSTEETEGSSAPSAVGASTTRNETLPVTLPSRKGAAPVSVADDETPSGPHVPDRPPLADAAAAIVLASASFARERGARPLAEIRVLTGATSQLIGDAGLIMADVASEPLSSLATRLAPEILDRIRRSSDTRSRGAIATGHACGADGATLVVSLVHALASSGGGRGAAIASGASGEIASIVVDV